MRFTAIRSVENRATNREGFTLIELMIALMILGVLLTGIYRVFISQDSMFRGQEEMAKMQENLRATSEFMNQELSWAGYGIPGLAVLYAGTSQIIYQANLPNTGGTDSFVRYTFDATNERIMRAVETTLAAAQNDNNLKVLANDVDSLTFSYFDGFGSQLSQITPSTPAVSPTNDNALATIRRVRSRFEVKSSRPDWNYTHPTAGDHFRRRSAAIEVKTRNVEDVTVSATGVGTGTCSSFVMQVSYPGASGKYSSCSDQQVELALGTQTLTDNPLVTVTVVDPDGNPDNNTPVSVSADYGYIFKDSGGATRSVITGRSNGIGSLYLAADSTAVAAEGTAVTVNTYFTPPEAGCLQLSQTETLSITSGMASRFDTTAPYDVSPITAEYVDLGTEVALSPQPGDLAVCSSQSNEGLRLKARLVDDCGNGIEGQTVNFSAVAGSFKAGGTKDNGDGSYEVIYVPPDTITLGAPSGTDTVTANWVEGSQSKSTTVSLKPAAPDHIVINDITGPASYGFLKTGADSFELWRLQGQTVTTNLSVLDQCGNRVFGEGPDTTMTPTNGTTTPNPNPTPNLTDGTYTFYWTSEDTCGDAITGQSIQIDNTHTPSKTVTFDLLTTPPSVFNVAVSLNLGAPDLDLIAGGNAPFCTDHVDITASLVENTGGVCGNLTDPFAVDFSVAGQTTGLGNGSFAAIAGSTTLLANSDVGGVAHATLYPGDARYAQKLNVNAVGYIAGAPTDPVTVQIDVTETPTQDLLSGIYDSSGYSNERNLSYPDRSFNPNDTLYPRVVDCDENENITLQDPSGYPPVQAIFQSLLTGDSVTVDLTEDTSNSADFRLPAGVATQLNAVADTTDTVLQVGYGDQITMYYADKDFDPPPPNLALAWHTEAYISGPRWMKLYKVDLPSTETLITGPTYELSDGDKYRAKVYIPEFEGDSGPSAVGTMTDIAAANAQYGGETDSFTLREAANTGIFIPDSSVYGVDYNTVSRTANPASPNDQVWLNIPYTPDRVTVYYPDTASPIFTQSFLIHDSDPPDVSVTSTGTSGTIPINVSAVDTGNSLDPGISAIKLYIDSINVHSWIPTANPVIFSWQTTSAAGTVFWLNGNHTVYAKAWDKAGNLKQSSNLTVNVLNPGATAINFTQPASNSVLSQSMTVAFEAPDVDNYSIYTCSISGMASTPADVPMAADKTCTFTSWDLTSVPDSTYSLTGTITDNQGNSSSTASPRVIIVDNTGPTVSLATIPTWVGDQASVTINADVTDSNGVSSTSVNGDLSGDCTNLAGATFSAVGTTYQYIWAENCPGVDGSQTLTVRGSDLAAPANEGSSTVTFNVDTIHPVLAPINASPIAGTYLSTGYFVNGVVTISSAVTDNHAAGAFISLDLAGPTPPVVYSRPLDTPSTEAFHYTWDTSGTTPVWPQGLYEVIVSGTDMAANANTNTEVAYLYVDRTAPSISGPTIPANVTSIVNATFDANPNYGHLSTVSLLIYDPSNALAYSDITYYSSAAGVASTVTLPSSPIDSRAWSTNGTYQVLGYAADHAGNANSTARVSFEVCNREVAITAHNFNNISGSNYTLTVQGMVAQLTSTGPSGIENEPLTLDVDSASAGTFSLTGNTTLGGAGAFSLTTSASKKLVVGTTVDVQLTDTGSGCDPAFAIDKPSYSYTVLP